MTGLCRFSARVFQEIDGGGRTFAHPAVLAQHVARGTLALVRAHHVDAAEGAQQGVLGALVDVCGRSRVKQLAGGGRKKHQRRLRKCHLPSQVIMEPGSKPSSHAHSKPPMTLVHVPLPQGFPMLHSLVSVAQTQADYIPLRADLMRSIRLRRG